MDKRARLLGFAAVCVLAAVVVSGSGCSPRSQSPGDAGFVSQKSPLEKECERELLHLDSLLESRRRTADFPAAAIAEATELRRSAMELILDEEYELALELIDEAIALLEPNN
jgi:hypothetical protein